MREPFGAISMASMSCGAVCDRLLNFTCNDTTCSPAGTETVIGEGYGFAVPALVPVPGMLIAAGLVNVKFVGTVRSSSRNDASVESRNGVRFWDARRDFFWGTCGR